MPKYQKTSKKQTKINDFGLLGTPLERPLGRLGGLLGLLRALLGRLGTVLGRLGALLGRLGALLGRLRGLLGACQNKRDIQHANKGEKGGGIPSLRGVFWPQGPTVGGI